MVNNIFEAAFVSEDTREALSHSGHGLPAPLAAQHPTMSLLPTATQVHYNFFFFSDSSDDPVHFTVSRHKIDSEKGAG